MRQLYIVVCGTITSNKGGGGEIVRLFQIKYFFQLFYTLGLFTLILAAVFQSSQTDIFSLSKLVAVLMR